MPHWILWVMWMFWYKNFQCELDLVCGVCVDHVLNAHVKCETQEKYSPATAENYEALIRS